MKWKIRKNVPPKYALSTLFYYEAKEREKLHTLNQRTLIDMKMKKISNVTEAQENKRRTND